MKNRFWWNVFVLFILLPILQLGVICHIIYLAFRGGWNHIDNNWLDYKVDTTKMELDNRKKRKHV